jgi:hypothetical protein
VVAGAAGDGVRDDPAHVVLAAGAGDPAVEGERDVADDGTCVLGGAHFSVLLRVTGLSGVPDRVLLPAARLSSSDLMTSGPELEVAMAASVVSPVLVGRAAESAAVRSAYERARSRRPTTVLVSGEAGIGKPGSSRTPPRGFRARR